MRALLFFVAFCFLARVRAIALFKYSSFAPLCKSRRKPRVICAPSFNRRSRSPSHSFLLAFFRFFSGYEKKIKKALAMRIDSVSGMAATCLFRNQNARPICGGHKQGGTKRDRNTAAFYAPYILHIR